MTRSVAEVREALAIEHLQRDGFTPESARAVVRAILFILAQESRTPEPVAEGPFPLGSIRTFRKGLGITMGEVADYAAWPVTRVSDIERGIGAPPTRAEIHTYMNALGDLAERSAPLSESAGAKCSCDFGEPETPTCPIHGTDGQKCSRCLGTGGEWGGGDCVKCHGTGRSPELTPKPI